MTIEGRNPVIEAFAAGHTIDKIFIAKGVHGMDKIYRLAKQSGVAVLETDRAKLDAMSETKAHQGVVALAAAVEYANEYLITTAGQRNRNRADNIVNVSQLPFATQELLFDPQTSGGLLIAVAPDEADELVSRIRENGDKDATIIGEVAVKSEKPVLFR